MTCNADTPEAGLDLCDGPDCCVVMSARDVYAWTTINGMVAKVCGEACLVALSAAEVKRTTCEGCGARTEASDRHPTSAGGVRCSRCELRLANAVGFQLGATMAKRGMSVVRGGRS